jgi:hypothetical protein
MQRSQQNVLAKCKDDVKLFKAEVEAKFAEASGKIRKDNEGLNDRLDRQNTKLTVSRRNFNERKRFSLHAKRLPLPNVQW